MKHVTNRNRKKQRTYKQKPVDELTFADDFMFGRILLDKFICMEFIRRLLRIRITHIEYPKLQKVLNPCYQAKGIRLDVYASDGKRSFDIEIQVASKKTLPLRMRYYQSLMDTDTLLKGQQYDSLKQSYVIFICMFDPFKKGLPVYTFENRCAEDSSIKFDDKSYKVCYNARAFAEERDPNIKAILEYLRTRTTTDDFTQKLDEMVEQMKLSEQFRREYMIISPRETDARNDGRREGIRIGKQRGIAQGVQKTAKNLVKLGVCSHEQIAQATGLSLEQVREIAEKA